MDKIWLSPDALGSFVCEVEARTADASALDKAQSWPARRVCLPPGARELRCLFQLLNELSSDHAAAKEELDALQDAATSQNSQKSSD